MKKFVAVLLCALMLLSAMIPAAMAEDMVTVSLYIPTLAPYTEDAIQAVQAAMNEHLAENYGIQCKLVYIEIGNFEQAANLAMTTPELDITCYFTDGGQLANFVRNGQLLDLTDRYEAAEGDIKNVFTESELKASSMNGKLYGFVRKYQYGGFETVVMNKDIVEELGIDAASIDSMDKLGEVLYQVNEAHPEIYALVPQSSKDMTWIRPYIRSIGLTTFAYLNLNPEMDDTQLKSLFETDSFREFCAYTNKWYNDGLIMADAISNTREGSDMVSAGAAFATLHNADIDPLTIIVEKLSFETAAFRQFIRKGDHDMDRYMNPELSPKERAKDLLSRMSTNEKLKQLIGAFPRPGHGEALDEAVAGGIGQYSMLEMRRLNSLEAASQWQRDLQRKAMAASPHHIPAVFHMEGLCGAYIQGAASFPAGISRGSSFDPELENEIGRAISRQERAVGVTQIFAPVLDVSRDSRMGRQGETYGEDPTLAAAMGAAYTAGIQAEDTDGLRAESVAKHFLGFHHSQGGIHGADAEVPERLLREIYAKPFQAAITESGLRGIMPCYCTLNGKAVSASKAILTNLLREEMGFDGVTVSDYGAMGNAHNAQHMFETMTEAGLACLEAGLDVELPSRATLTEELAQWFDSGKADVAVLDCAVLRVLEAKFRMGLFEHPFAPEGEALKKAFYSESDRALSLRSAREGMVLLKNGGALPISKKTRKIAVIGCHAVNPRYYFAGYTHLSMVEAILAVEGSMAGVKTDGPVTDYERIPGTQIQVNETPEFDEVLNRLCPGCTSLLDELKRRLPDTEVVWAYGYPCAGDDTSHYAEALEVMRDADLILFTLGGKYTAGSISTTGEGVDDVFINLPPCQDGLIEKAAALGIPMAGVHFDGRPISSDIADEHLDAILEAWCPGETGAQAVADVLLGDCNPAGRLPVCVARNAGQIPVYYNHPHGSSWHQGESIGFQDYASCSHRPRYFFGHGLSYTRFEYSGLKVSQDEIGPHDGVNISFTVRNAGDVDGDEVAQLYVSDPFASMIRPVKELAGFCRIHLRAGKAKRVTFALRADQLAFLDKNMNWNVEQGRFDVQVGASSEDIRLNGSYRVARSAIIDGRTRGFYARTTVEEN